MFRLELPSADGGCSTIQAAMVEAFVGSYLVLDGLNAQLLLGEKIELVSHSQAVAAMTRVAVRLGLARRPRDLGTLDPLTYAREHGDRSAHGDEGGEQ